MESRRMRSRSQILKWVCYAVALFVCAALQTTPGLLQLGQAKPLFILPLCLAVAVYEGEFALIMSTSSRCLRCCANSLRQ